MTRVAFVLGGSERVWDDAERARHLCADLGLAPCWFAANDMIALWQDPITAVTLHPDKLHTWLAQRRNSGLPMPTQVWSHDGGDSRSRPNPCVTNRLRDWGGSVGLFGYAVARQRHDRVVLCGVPMTRDSHFIRKSPWVAVSAFLRPWENRRDEMLPHCRSLSGGTTGAMFGEPTAEWLLQRAARERPEERCSATG